MSVRRDFGRFVASAFGAACAVACLPNDTRTPPGSVLVDVISDGVAADGIAASATTDGWAIQFDQVLVSLGNVSLDGDSCDVYSDSAYNRLFDMKVAGKQKVSILYALGHCDFGFRVSSPNADTVLGQRATDTEKNMMRTPGSDAFTDDAGMSMYVRGSATRGDETKTFAWPFRFRARFDRCATSPDFAGSGSSEQGIDLQSKAAKSALIEVRPGLLFADQLNTAVAQPRFQVFADADSVTGNADGEVTLDELSRIPLSLSGFVDGDESADAGGFAGLDAGYIAHVEETFDGGEEPSLADYVYLVLFPGMVRYDGNGVCGVRLTNRGVSTN